MMKPSLMSMFTVNPPTFLVVLYLCVAKVIALVGLINLTCVGDTNGAGEVVPQVSPCQEPTVSVNAHGVLLLVPSTDEQGPGLCCKVVD